MSNKFENIFNTPQYEVIEADIEKDDEYESRLEEKKGIIERIKNMPRTAETIRELFKGLSKARRKKQEVMRSLHQKESDELAQEYEIRYAGIADGDTESSEEKIKLFEQLSREQAYYEMNPSGEEWLESDAETAEREFARGKIMQEELAQVGLGGMKIAQTQLNPDAGGLSVSYEKEAANLENFDSASARKAIQFLYDIQKIDRPALQQRLKDTFACQELIFITEDIMDSFEGYKDNTLSLYENEDITLGNDVLAIQETLESFIDSQKEIYERYQAWDEYYLVNNSYYVDNLSEESQAINWDNLGVTNNIFSVLINDYGQLRQSAEEEGHDEFVSAMDERIKQIYVDKGDKEAGEAIVALTKIRNLVLTLSGVCEEENDEEISEERRAALAEEREELLKKIGELCQ